MEFKSRTHRAIRVATLVWAGNMAARRVTDDTIDSYIDRRGLHGLATALTYTVAREQGETTHRLMAADLDLSVLEAEVILQALRPVVHEHFSIDAHGASLSDIVDEEDLDV